MAISIASKLIFAQIQGEGINSAQGQNSSQNYRQFLKILFFKVYFTEYLTLYDNISFLMIFMQ